MQFGRIHEGLCDELQDVHWRYTRAVNAPGLVEANWTCCQLISMKRNATNLVAWGTRDCVQLVVVIESFPVYSVPEVGKHSGNNSPYRASFEALSSVNQIYITT